MEEKSIIRDWTCEKKQRINHYNKDAWMSEREEYCDDGWIFLNTLPTLTSLAKQSKKQNKQTNKNTTQKKSPDTSYFSSTSTLVCVTSGLKTRRNTKWAFGLTRAAVVAAGGDRETVQLGSQRRCCQSWRSAYWDFLPKTDHVYTETWVEWWKVRQKERRVLFFFFFFFLYTAVIEGKKEVEVGPNTGLKQLVVINSFVQA